MQEIPIRFCPACGEEFQPHILTCLDCGAETLEGFEGQEPAERRRLAAARKKTAPEREEEKAVPEADDEPQELELGVCPACGTKLGEGAAECPDCGLMVGALPEWMEEDGRALTPLVICVAPRDAESLQALKVYRRLPDEGAEGEGYFRVVDDSGEEVLYRRSCFRLLPLPPVLEKHLEELALQLEEE